MKKIILFAVMALAMTSCYTSRVYHGTVTENTSQIEIASKRNHIMLWGLLPLKTGQKASDVLGNKTNYTTQNTWTFIDGFLNVITYGIYTPTTTKYYVPWDEVKDFDH
jgi:hypothetical protein